MDALYFVSNGQGLLQQHEVPVVDDAHRAPLLVLVFILEFPKPIVQHLCRSTIHFGVVWVHLDQQRPAWRNNSVPSTPVLPLTEIARLATQMANGGSHPG